MNWQRDPHDKWWTRRAQQWVSAAITLLLFGLLALAADNFARCAARRLAP